MKIALNMLFNFNHFFYFQEESSSSLLAPGSALGQLISGFIDVVPKIFGALAIIIVGLIIAKLIAKLIKNLLDKIGIDRLAEKLQEIDIISKANLKISFSNIISKIVYYFLLLVFITAGTDVLGMDAISTLFSDLLQFIPKLLVALIILVIGIIFSEALRKIILTTCKSLGIPSANLISSFVFYFMIVNILIVALTQASIDTDFLSSNISIIIGGIVAAFSIGYGFASKDIVANFLASYYSKDKFTIGDRISVDGFSGEIVDIDRSSVTLSMDGKKLIVPMQKMINENIEIID